VLQIVYLGAVRGQKVKTPAQVLALELGTVLSITTCTLGVNFCQAKFSPGECIDMIGCATKERKGLGRGWREPDEVAGGLTATFSPFRS
jgi:hypothetical protein